jgi:hypothetical protein
MSPLDICLALGFLALLSPASSSAEPLAARQLPGELTRGVDLPGLQDRFAGAGAAGPAAAAQGASARFVGVTVTYGKEGQARMEGVLVEETADTLYISKGIGRAGIPRSIIVTIEYGRNKYVEFMERNADVDPKDAGALWELSLWAESQALTSLAKKAAGRVIEADPEHAAAREFLGYEKFQGAWMTFPEMMRAQGLVLYKGDWITPEALQAAKEEELRIREARMEAARLEKQIRLEREYNRRLQMQAQLQQQQAFLNMIAARMYYPGCAYYSGMHGYWTYPSGSWLFVNIRVPGNHSHHPHPSRHR